MAAERVVLSFDNLLVLSFLKTCVEQPQNASRRSFFYFEHGTRRLTKATTYVLHDD
eukprot:SAG31_NODE_4257_length_3414_cov_1.764706_4_plen_56_part_00